MASQKREKSANPSTHSIQSKPSSGNPWVFRLTAIIIVPLLFFAVLEAGLRISGYGYSTHFLTGPDNRGRYETNPRFGLRYFPKSLARAPIPGFISAKPVKTIRIFILGDSAAMGFPNYEFGLGRILKVMLQERYPSYKFEVINAAMTAINSHATRAIAQDCAEHQPDLFIVYMGNNEVIGPFGPGTVFQSWIPNLSLIRANLRVKSTRTGQLLNNLFQNVRPEKKAPAWQGMEMFLNNTITIEDPRLRAVYANLRQNILDICHAGRKSGAAVILSTLAVNLKDCPPFASRHRSSLSDADLAQWETLFKSGKAMEEQGRIPEALNYYNRAAKLDDFFAELRFRLARCLELEGNMMEARKHFQAACDLDALRFRSDSRINQIIREIAAAPGIDGVFGVDAEKHLTDNGAIAGSGHFFEHVHLTFDGNYRVAELFMDRIETALPQLRNTARTNQRLSRQECAALLAMTPVDESQSAAKIADLMSRPPFTYQLDNHQRVIVLRRQAQIGTELAQKPETYAGHLKTLETALQKYPEDWLLHQRYGKLLLDGGEAKKAIQHLETALQLYPGESSLFNDLGFAHFLENRIPETLEFYRKALDLNPQSAPTHANLALVYAGQKQYAEASAEYEKALQIAPSFIEARINYAGLLSTMGRNTEAMEEYRRAIRIDPKNAAAHYGLAMMLTDSGKTEEGIAEYREALKHNPGMSEGHVNLGSALAGQGRIKEALYHFKKAIEINPRDALAYYCTGKALLNTSQYKEAVYYFERALEIKPDFSDARRYLQVLLKAIQ